jgi:transglutaminase-like putative cysteine protease
MTVHVHWQTTYRYTEPVRLLHTELRVLPTSRPGGQRVAEASMELAPPARPMALPDVFGNTFHHVDFLDPINLLHVSVTAEVDTTGDQEPADDLSPLLDRLYRQSTPRAPFEPALRSMAPSADEPLEAARSLTFSLPERFGFQVGVTDVGHTALDFLSAGQGVCQDFSHLTLALLRMKGHAARYVSGYLAPALGDATAEASHAWVQVLADGAWWGFDPSNGVLQDERYVVTAVGRDYDDVPPLRGTFTGRAVEEWTTSLRVDSGRQ